MSSKRVFSRLAARTHMPFFSDGTIIFCMNEEPAQWRPSSDDPNRTSTYRPWKIYRADWAGKSIRQVRTAMPEKAVLCNPMFFRENNQLHVSFIAGIPNANGWCYKLYKMYGADWDMLGDPVPVADEFSRTGFVSPRHFCLGGEHQLQLLDRVSHKRFRITTSLNTIARVTFDPQQPSRLLITGAKEGRFKTLIYDVDADTVREIVGPAPIYKACLVGNRIVFSYRESEDVEGYQLHVASLELQPASDSVSMTSV